METLSLYLDWFASLHSQIVSFVSLLATLLSTAAVFYVTFLGYRYFKRALGYGTLDDYFYSQWEDNYSQDQAFEGYSEDGHLIYDGLVFDDWGDVNDYVHDGYNESLAEAQSCQGDPYEGGYIENGVEYDEHGNPV